MTAATYLLSLPHPGLALAAVSLACWGLWWVLKRKGAAS